MQGFIYFFRRVTGGPIKIGFSIEPDSRLKNLQTGSDEQLECLGAIGGTMDGEKELHERFAAFRLSGEWFSADRSLLEFIATNSEKVPVKPVREITKRAKPTEWGVRLFTCFAVEAFGERKLKRGLAAAAGITEKGAENWLSGKSSPCYNSLTNLFRAKPIMFQWFMTVVVAEMLAKHAGITKEQAGKILIENHEYVTPIYLCQDKIARAASLDSLMALAGDSPRAECFTYLEEMKGVAFRDYQRRIAA